MVWRIAAKNVGERFGTFEAQKVQVRETLQLA
jgi:hypothetical protein